MKRSNLRPCMVGGTIKGYFHQWAQKSEIVCPSALRGGHAGGVIADCFGIVEFEDGTVKEVYPHVIRFLDCDEYE